MTALCGAKKLSFEYEHGSFGWNEMYHPSYPCYQPARSLIRTSLASHDIDDRIEVYIHM